MCSYDELKEQLGTMLTEYDKVEKIKLDEKFNSFKPSYEQTSLYSASECITLGVSGFLSSLSLLVAIGYGIATLINKSTASASSLSCVLFLGFAILLGGIYITLKKLTDSRIKSYVHKRDYTITESVRPYKFSYRAYGREIIDNGKGSLYIHVPKRFSFWRNTSDWYKCGLVNYETGRVVMQVPLAFISQDSREYITVINAYRQEHDLD